MSTALQRLTNRNWSPLQSWLLGDDVDFFDLRQTPPGVETKVDKDTILVAFDMAGCDKESLDVSINDKFLLVHGKKKSLHGETDINKSVSIDTNKIDINNIKASFTNGILTVTLHRPPPEKRNHRKIEIS